MSVLFEVTWPSWQAGVSSGTNSELCAGPVPACSPQEVYVASSSSTIKSPNYSGRIFCPKQVCLSESNWIACLEASTNRMFPFKCYGLLAHTRITQGSTWFLRTPRHVINHMMMGTSEASAHWHFLVEVQQLVPFMNMCSFWSINFRMENH